MYQQLPIFEHHDRIINSIQNNKILIISGRTGCGKSTQIPQFILANNPKCKIAICQPRRIAAIYLAIRVSHQQSSNLGSIVGYHIGRDSKMYQKTNLIYMTYGILIQQLLFQPQIKYTHIILDQVHQRSLEMDFTFIALKKILQNTPIKLIIMSATINCQEFSKYFSTHRQTGSFIEPKIQINLKKPQNNRGNRGNRNNSNNQQQAKLSYNNIDYIAAQMIILPEKNKYKVQTYYWQNLSQFCQLVSKRQNIYSVNEDIYIEQQTYYIAAQLINYLQGKYNYNKINGDILIFVPGMIQIKTLKNIILTQYNHINENNIIQVHSIYTQTLYTLLENPNIVNKIIIATNIGQSSITLKNCKAVIDFALTRKNYSNKMTGYSRFETTMASKANLLQRAGRVGRVSNGQVYRLITIKDYQNINDYDIPEIKCVSLEMCILKAKQMDLTNKNKLFQDPYVLLLNALEPPKVQDIKSALNCLICQQALVIGNNNKFQITKIGSFMVSLPCDIKISKFILLGLKLGISQIIIDIASIIICCRNFYIHEDKINNIEQYMHSMINYDQSKSNDYLLKVELFSHWKYRFYKEYYLKQKIYIEKNNNNQNQDSQKIIQKKNAKVEKFCQIKCGNEELKWCNNRGVYTSVMREILKISENLKYKLMEMKFNQWDAKNHQWDHQLILICLVFAFQQTSCEIKWTQNDALRINGNSFISMVNDEANTEKQIHKFCEPQPLQTYTIKKYQHFTEIYGNAQILKKFLLPSFYSRKNINQTSKLYRFTNKNKLFYTWKSDITNNGHQIRIRNESINKVIFRPQNNSEYLLLTNSIQQSKGRYNINCCALISEIEYYLILLLVKKQINLILHSSHQFYDYIIISKQDKFRLPIILNSQDIQEIINMHQIIKKSYHSQITIQNQCFNNNQLNKLITILNKNYQIKPKFQEWQNLFNFQNQNNKNQQQQKLYQIQNLPKIINKKQQQNYYFRYKEWKYQKYLKLYKQFYIYNIEISKIICKKCYPKQIIEIQDLLSFNIKKQLLQMNQYKGSWKILQEQKQIIYCRKQHQIGLIEIIEQEQWIKLNFQNILIYLPYNKIINIPNIVTKQWLTQIQLEVKLRKSILENKRIQVQSIECPICFQGNDLEPFKRCILYKDQLQNNFWKRVKSHMYSVSHLKKCALFIQGTSLDRKKQNK